MNDSAPAQETPALETSLAEWDERLVALERQAMTMLRSARRLRKAAQEGAVAGFPNAVAATQQDAAKLQEAVSQAADTPPIDIPTAFSTGAFLNELAAAAAAANVTLVQRDG